MIPIKAFFSNTFFKFAMVRISLKYNLETKQHDWKLLDGTSSPALITIVTNHGEVTLRNHPGECNTYTVIFASRCSNEQPSGHDNTYSENYKASILKYPYLPFLWIRDQSIFNPIVREWMPLVRHPNPLSWATLIVLEFDFISYVTKFIPKINALIAQHTVERTSVAKEMEIILESVPEKKETIVK